MRIERTGAEQAVEIAKMLQNKEGLTLREKIFERTLFTGRVLLRKRYESSYDIKFNESRLNDFAPELTALGKFLLPLIYDESDNDPKKAKDGEAAGKILDLNEEKAYKPHTIIVFKASGRVR